MMFEPVPFDTGRTDDDTAAIIWRRGRKQLVLNLNCYGSYNVSCGLISPAAGSIENVNFDIAWKWFCDDSDTLIELEKCSK